MSISADAKGVVTIKDLQEYFPHHTDFTSLGLCGEAEIFEAFDTSLDRSVVLWIKEKGSEETNLHTDHTLSLTKICAKAQFPNLHDAGVREDLLFIELQGIEGTPIGELALSEWRKQRWTIEAEIDEILRLLADHSFDCAQLDLSDFVLTPSGVSINPRKLLTLPGGSGSKDSPSLKESITYLNGRTKRSYLIRSMNIGVGIFALTLLAVLCLDEWGRRQEAKQADLTWQTKTSSPPTTSKHDDHYLTCDNSTCPRRLTSLLKAGKFKELETIAQELRSSMKKFNTGEAQLSMFYDKLLQGDFQFVYLSRERVLEKMDDWVSEYSESVTANVAKALAYTTYGFAEWQNTGTSGTFSQRRERAIWYFERALEAYEEAHGLTEKDPHLYALWMRTLMGYSTAKQVGLQPERIETVYQLGRKVAPDFHFLYYETAWHHLSCWNGKPGDAERFALRAHEDTKDIDGFSIYTMIALHFLRGSNTRRFESFDFSWTIIREQIPSLAAAYPNSLELIASLTWFACRWNDRPLAKEMFAQLARFTGTSADGELDNGWNGTSKRIWRTSEAFEGWRAWATQDAPRP